MSSRSRLEDPAHVKAAKDFVRTLGVQGLAHLADMAAISIASRDQDAPAATSAGKLGIWSVLKEPSRLTLKRGGPKEEWRYWADLEEQVFESGSKKVALVGESVARGYLLDPVHTFAESLGAHLNDGNEGPRSHWGVVDLARTDLMAPAIEDLLDGLAQIEPDAVVLFFGNNLPRAPLSSTERLDIAAHMAKGGLAAAQAHWRDFILPAKIDRVLDKAARLGLEPSRVIVVVPEFNLANWLEDEVCWLPWIPGENVAPWFEQRARYVAEVSKPAPSAQLLRKIAERVMALDEGLTWLSHRARAEAALQDGDDALARQHLERSRDSRVCLFTPHTPRCPRSVQERLKERAKHHGFTVVDLRALLKSSKSGDLPAKEFFLDYCHLSLAGIDHVAGAIAPHVDPLVSSRRPDAIAHAAVSPGLETSSFLLAAVHNAHYGQDARTYGFYLKQIRADRHEAGHVLRMLLALQVEPGFTWSNPEFLDLQRHPLMSRYFSGDDRALGGKFDDSALTAALEETHENLFDGAKPSSVDVLLQTLGAGNAQDLRLPIAHARSFRALHNYTYGQPSAYMKMFDIETQFRFAVTDTTMAHQLAICSRSAGSEPQLMSLMINDESLATFASTRSWTSHNLELPSGLLRAGLNRLTLQLPPAINDAVHPDRLARRLLRGETIDSMAWFGELLTLRVTSTASTRPITAPAE